MSEDSDRTLPALPLRRRDFLALGSLVALAPWMDRAAGAAVLGEAPDTAAAGGQRRGGMPTPLPTLPMSLGYLEGSEELDNLRKLPPDLRVLTVTRRGRTLLAGRRMLPAHEMPAGDPALVGGAVRMTVHDLYPSRLPDDPAAAGLWPVALDLDVLIPLLEPPAGSTARYAAWSYRRLPAEDRSARVSFLLWPDWYSDLSVILRVVPAGADAKPRLLQASFTLAAQEGRPRLLKGVYLLGFAPGVWNEPVDLPDDPSQVPPELQSVLVTIEPEGVRRSG
jgi:hypothetical protein